MKKKRMDPKLVSKTRGEIGYEAKKTGKSSLEVRSAKKIVGRSRKKIESELGFKKKEK